MKSSLCACTMLLITAAGGGMPSAAAQFDQAVLMKWAAVQNVRYEVVGEYNDAQTMIIEGGYAAVQDRIDLVFVFDPSGGGLVGDVLITNYPATASDIRDYGSNCNAPSISAPYDHATVTKAENGYGGDLHLSITRTMAGGAVAVQCTGGPKQVAAETIEELEQLAVPPPTLLALAGDELDESFQAFPATDTFVVKDGGWTWTYKLTAPE